MRTLNEEQRFGSGYVPLVEDAGAGMAAILAECRRQHKDAVTTLASRPAALRQATESLGTTRRALLLGMGASHFVNQIAAARLRVRGIDAVAVTLTEQLSTPLPTTGKTVILVSQSGDSGEVVRYLADRGDLSHHIGLSLSADSALSRSVPTILAAGGRESGFAATRSFTLSLVLYSMILDGLGADPAEDGYDPDREAQVHENLETVLGTIRPGRRSMVYTGRGMFDGLAAMAALGSMELGRVPALSLEGGQLRHGPIEMLAEDSTVVLFQGPNTESHGVALAGFVSEAGGQMVVFDGAGSALPPGVTGLSFPPGEGLASVFEMLPSVQAWTIALAARSNEALGLPRFCDKVTTGD